MHRTQGAIVCSLYTSDTRTLTDDGDKKCACKTVGANHPCGAASPFVPM